jgi:hypothetical protein
LLAYIVSNYVNFLVGMIERDCDNIYGNKVEGLGDEGMVEVLKKANNRKR